jgi:acyl dehydratase
MPKLYWDSVDLGDPVSPLIKPPVTRVQIAKFAGASNDWSPLHIDDDFAKGAGYGSVFAHGAISLGFATEAVSRWLENGRVLATTATFQKLVWPGDILTAKGVVVQRYERNGEARIDVDVWAENQNHDIVMKGQVTCILWRNDKEEKKGKGLWPAVSPETLRDRKTARPITKGEADVRETGPQAHAAERGRGRPSPPPAQKPAAPAPAKAAPAPVKAAAPAPAKAAPAPAKAAPAKAAPAKPSKPEPKAAAKPSKPAPVKAAKPAPAKPAPKAVAKAPAKPTKPVAKAPAKPSKPAPKAPAKPAAKKPDPKAKKKK